MNGPALQKLVPWSGSGVVMVLGALALGCPQLLDDAFTLKSPDAGQAPLDCAPFQLCSGSCVDVESNPSHCGECGADVASGQICSSGNAVAASQGCGVRTLCSGGCVDTESHPFFCGSCDTTCKPGSRCMMGRCACAPPLARDCGEACRECCGDGDCPMDKMCAAGVCELQCSAEEAECGDRCVDLDTDPRNCGACRTDCGREGVCVSGQCQP